MQVTKIITNDYLHEARSLRSKKYTAIQEVTTPLCKLFMYCHNNTNNSLEKLCDVANPYVVTYFYYTHHRQAYVLFKVCQISIHISKL